MLSAVGGENHSSANGSSTSLDGCESLQKRILTSTRVEDSNLEDSNHDHPLLDVVEGLEETDSASLFTTTDKITRRASASSVGSLDHVNILLSDPNRRRLTKASKERSAGSSGRLSSRSVNAHRSESRRDESGDLATYVEIERELANLKVELATTKACNETLQYDLANSKACNESLELQLRVLQDENCMLRTQMCSAKTSETKLRHKVAGLETEIAALKSARSSSYPTGEFKKERAVERRDSGFGGLAKALLGSEIHDAEALVSGYDGGNSAPPARQEPPTLASRLRRQLSTMSLEQLPLKGELQPEEEPSRPRRATRPRSSMQEFDDGSVKESEDRPHRRPSRRRSSMQGGNDEEEEIPENEDRPRRRAQRRTSNTSIDDAVEVQCELDTLAAENDKLRGERATLAAEADRLRSRLNRMMSVDVSSFNLAQHDNDETEHDQGDAVNTNDAASSLRDFMAKVTSRRNINDRSSFISRPSGRGHQHFSSASSVQSVDDLLWDSFNDSQALSQDSASFYTTRASIAEENAAPSYYPGNYTLRSDKSVNDKSTVSTTTESSCHSRAA